MSSLTSIRRNMKREAGTLQRIIGYHHGPLGILSSFPKRRTLRSWAIYRNHGEAGPWLLIDGFQKDGTKPGRRRKSRFFRNRYGWDMRKRGSLIGGAP